MNRLVLLAFFLTPSIGSAEPWIRHTIDDSSRGADGVRLADVNDDGFLDVATGWEEGGQVRVYLNPGPKESRSRWPLIIVGNVQSPEDAVFADLDGDGAVDVVSCCEGKDRTVYVHWAPTRPADYGRAEAWQTSAFDCTERKQMWMYALPMQIDAARGIDLVVGSKGKDASIGWLEAPAQPRDMGGWKFHRLYQAGWIMSLQAHDMDGDGDLDVLASDRKGSTRGVLWLENRGPAVAWPAHRLGGSDREVMFLSLADRFLRGRRHVVCAVRGRGIMLLEETPTAENWHLSELPLPAGCGTGKGIAVGDIDLDGHSDIVFSCESANANKSGVRWLARRDNSSTSWRSHEISGPVGVKFDRVELLDLDADGDLDVLTCEERKNLGVIWYENPTRTP